MASENQLLTEKRSYFEFIHNRLFTNVTRRRKQTKRAHCKFIKFYIIQTYLATSTLLFGMSVSRDIVYTVVMQHGPGYIP
jgi:hypothetical protein